MFKKKRLYSLKWEGDKEINPILKWILHVLIGGIILAVMMFSADYLHQYLNFNKQTETHEKY